MKIVRSHHPLVLDRRIAQIALQDATPTHPLTFCVKIALRARKGKRCLFTAFVQKHWQSLQRFSGWHVHCQRSSGTSCTACAAGDYPDLAQGGCLTCDDGQFVSALTNWTCTACPPGRFLYVLSQSAVSVVVTTMFDFQRSYPNRTSPAATCTFCGSGTGNNATGSTLCTSCTSGFYATQALTGGICTPCAAGQNS